MGSPEHGANEAGEVRPAGSHLRVVVDRLPVGVRVFDADGTSLLTNNAWNGICRPEHTGPENSSIYENGQLRSSGLMPYIQECIASGEQVVTPPLLFDPAHVGREGSPRWIEAVVSPVMDEEGRLRESVLSLEDVTDHRELEERLARSVFHDGLTGLPNGKLFREDLGHALGRDGRDGEKVAVLFLDLDSFKFVNDCLGYGAGDLTLTQAASRIKGCLRPGDTVARLGGDEFAVLLQDARAGEAEEAAGRIKHTLGVPTEVDGLGASSLTASIGATPDDLLRDASTAMHEAKTAGKDGRRSCAGNTRNGA